MEQTHENPKCFARQYTTRENTHIAGEDILPDYLPDIDKIVKTRVTLRPGQHTMENGKICSTGEAVFEVYYLSADATPAIRCIPLPYEIQCTAEGIDAESIVRFSQKAEAVSCRPLSPRKLSVRSQIQMKLAVYSAENTAVIVTNAAPGAENTIVHRYQNLPACTMLAAESNDIKCSEDILIPEDMPPIEELMHIEVIPMPPALTSVEDGVEYTQECRVQLFYRSKGQDEKTSYHLYEKIFTMQGMIPLQDATEGLRCYGECTLGPMQAKAVPDAMGEMRTVELDCFLSISCLCFENQNLRVTTDAFSTAYATKKENSTIRCAQHLLQTRSGLSVSEHLKTDANVEKIIDLHSEANYAGFRTENGKLSASGTISVFGLFESGANEYHGFNGEIPWEFECDGKGLDDKCELTCCTAVQSQKASPSNNGIDVQIELAISLCGLQTSEKSLVSQIEMTNESITSAQTSQALVFYYAKKGEDIFEIARTYHTDPEMLRRSNGLDATAEVIQAEQSVLIIP